MKRVLWFRRDLRITDNPLLSFGGEVLPIFIFDVNILKPLPKDDRRVSFIYKHVEILKKELRACGLDLKIFYGSPNYVFEYLLGQYDFDEVVASGDYDSYAKERDRIISSKIHFRYIQDTYIFKHDEVLKDDGTPYLVFTPYYKKALKVLQKKNICEYEKQSHKLLAQNYELLTVVEDTHVKNIAFSIENIGFERVKPNHENRYIKSGSVLSHGAHEKLENFVTKLSEYKEQRDYLSVNATSGLSVHLRFGTIGVREILRRVMPLKDAEPFIRQLIFRDFYASLLFYMPYLEKKNYKYAFNGIDNKDKYEAFCLAKTGVPIVDAGVRQLVSTGKMHNRVRMIAASFFTKDLLLPWQWGEEFFAKYLLDYDKASNVLSWQWSAGTGVDPQPYFRVFNPYLQSKKFDKECLYIKHFLPELSDVQSKYLHDEEYLLSNDIPNYPKPILKHKDAAKKAVEAFKK